MAQVDAAPEPLFPPRVVDAPPLLPAPPRAEPGVLNRPLVSPPPAAEPPPLPEGPPYYQTPIDAPLGFTGRSGIIPRDTQDSNHFAPVEDRWRIGFPEWDRYGKGHPPVDDYPFVQGRPIDPFNQNVLKGDYAFFGQNIFLEVTAISQSLFEPRQVPTATTPFESTTRPDSAQFFGNPNQFLFVENLFLSLDLFHGDASFRPADWRVKLTPVFNVNYFQASELAVVNPNVLHGFTRGRTFTTLNEWFVETKIADFGPNYDFLSVRVGSQPFVSDFRGFIFADINRGVRLFGTRNSNREQYNFIYLRQQEKDTNSFLNSFRDRGQDIAIANYYIQDFIFPGYTSQVNFIYNHDNPSFLFDKNDFLVRPDPTGVFQPHRLDIFYLGWTGNGHINRINIDHAFYLALGHDSLNPIANQPQQVTAEMAALEVSYDRDYVRFRTSLFWASGDEEPRNRHATGFDTILDNPQFSGGEFSYWQRQQIRLFGVNLVNRMSLVPDLRSSKFQGQSNFVNPGIFIVNGGFDVDVTPKLRFINNCNFLWFNHTEVLRQFVYQRTIRNFIGADLSCGCEYRPFLNNNAILVAGISGLIPGDGFKDLFSNLRSEAYTQLAGFANVVFTY